MSLWTKSYDVTIQMKALCLYFHMMLFVCQNFWKRNLEIWLKFAFGHIWQWKGQVWLNLTEILFSFLRLDTLDSTLIMTFLLLRVGVRGQNLSEVKIKFRTFFFTLVDSQFYKELAHILKLQLVYSEHSELTSGHDSKLWPKLAWVRTCKC